MLSREQIANLIMDRCEEVLTYEFGLGVCGSGTAAYKAADDILLLIGSSPAFAASPSGGTGNVAGTSLDAWELAEERKRADLFVSKLNEAEGYATRLAQSLSDKHFPNPNWRPLPDLYGVLTQIDNMTTGMSRKSDLPSVRDCSGEAAETSGSADRQKPGHEVATPSLPLPNPPKGQEETPCPMTVEEAAAQACYAVSCETIRPSFKNWPGGWKPETWDELKEIERELHRNYARAVLSTIRASEEDR